MYRNAMNDLYKWKAKKDKKPLIIRGARQVGKTWLMREFGRVAFKDMVYINFDNNSQMRDLFAADMRIDRIITGLELYVGHKIEPLNTLLVFDEIQEVPEALNILRYIYEHAPQIHVIAAGSMLESLFNKDIHFPVGRVSYLMLRPVSFPEFLLATEETAAFEQLHQIPIQTFAHDKLLSLFHTYALIGGMPEVVAHYASQRDLKSLGPLYEGLLASYLDDVEKYSSSSAQTLQIRHAIQTSFHGAGHRIKFENFGNSSYKSREMGEALRILEKALLLHLVYPTTSATLPLIPSIGRSPRLHLLDTGLLNYMVGIQKEIIGTKDLASVYQGIMIEHLVGQELLAFQFQALSELSFWVRDKTTSNAKVDYLFLFDGKLIPIEVKSGAEGSLKSLHLYMDLAPHTMAVRFYSGPLAVNKLSTPSGKSFHLLNLPYYLVSMLEEYLSWFDQQLQSNSN